MRPVLLLLIVTLLGCGQRTMPTMPGNAASSASCVVEPDTRPAFALDPAKPFVIELGRGGGLDGLDIVKINETGRVELTQVLGKPIDESAQLQLIAADVSKLVALINSQKITSLGRSYTDPAIADGSQWILWIEQSPHEKAIFFNNSFPPQLMKFVEELDAVLEKNGLNSVAWKPAPQPQTSLQHQALWGRIQSRP